MANSKKTKNGFYAIGKTAQGIKVK